MIEPGQRDCYALMVVPSFAPTIRLTTVTNWFDLKVKHHPGQELTTTEMVHLGRQVQKARAALQRLCDSGSYRPTDVESLAERIDQLDALLPIQNHRVTLPFEADLTGSEVFNSTNAGLAPRLLTWYGEPASAGGSVFILGTGFNFDSIKVIVGGVLLSDPRGASATTPPGARAPASYDIISRNVIRIDIPAEAATMDTGVVSSYPTPPSGTREEVAGSQSVETMRMTVEPGRAQTPAAGGEIYRKTVEITRGTGLRSHAPAAVTPRPTNVYNATFTTFSAAVGVPFVGVVANFCDYPATSAPPNPNDYFITINWGDNVEDTPASFSQHDATSLDIIGRHTYSSVGPFTVDIKIQKRNSLEAHLFGAPEVSPATGFACLRRKIIDVHVATAHGISNHLQVEVPPGGAPRAQSELSPILPGTIPSSSYVPPSGATAPATAGSRVPASMRPDRASPNPATTSLAQPPASRALKPDDPISPRATSARSTSPLVALPWLQSRAFTPRSTSVRAPRADPEVVPTTSRSSDETKGEPPATGGSNAPSAGPGRAKNTDPSGSKTPIRRSLLSRILAPSR
jgi:hypothetical protein